MGPVRTSPNRAFTLVEILVVIGIIAVLMGLLLPALERAREQANTVSCAANLGQIGLSLLLYSDSNHGKYPRTIYDPSAPLAFGTNAAATDPFGPGGPQANDITAAIFLLIHDQHIPAKIFADPYTDEITTEADPAKDPLSRSNFTDYKRNLAYSYANPYPSPAAVSAGYQLNNRMNPAFAVAADRNSGVVGKNSRMHEGRGQNVLFADDHVEWEKTAKCGVSGDDIYSNKSGVIQASPTDATDSVLLPVN